MVKLGTIVDIEIGKTPSRANMEYWGEGNEWLTISDLNDLHEGKYVIKAEEQITDKAVKKVKANLIPSNTVLFSFKLTIGKVAITQKPFYTNEAIAALRIKPNVQMSTEYLFYAMKGMHKHFRVDYGAKGKTLNKNSLSSLKIAVPEIHTQNKIVAILDKILALGNYCDEAIALSEKITKNLFIEQFGNPFSDSKFKTERFGNQGNLLGGMAFSSKSFTDMGVPVIKIGNINKGFFDKSNLSYLSDIDARKYSQYIVKPNDLAISLTGTQGKNDFGNICRIDSTYSKYLLNQRVAKFVLDKSKYNSNFVYSLFKHGAVKERIIRLSRGARQANVSVADILDLKLIYPHIEIQNQFGKVLEPFFVIKQNLDRRKILLNNLLQSLVSRAVGGEDLAPEEKVFEDLLKHLEIKDFIEKKERIQYLANAVNRHEIRDANCYEVARDLVYQLLEQPELGLKQNYNSQNRKIELIITADEIN